MIFRLIRSAARSFGLVVADLIPCQAIAVARGRDFNAAGRRAGEVYANALDDPDDGGEAMEPKYHPFTEGFALPTDDERTGAERVCDYLEGRFPPIGEAPGPSWRDLAGTAPAYTHPETYADTVTPLVGEQPWQRRDRIVKILLLHQPRPIPGKGDRIECRHAQINNDFPDYHGWCDHVAQVIVNLDPPDKLRQ